MRDFAGPDDVRFMQHLTREIWSETSRWHVGDLAYARFQHLGRETDWPTRLWIVDGRTVAWGWIEMPDELTFQVHPHWPDLADEVVQWFVEVAADRPDRVATVGEHEAVLVDALVRNAFRPAGRSEPYFVQLVRGLDDLPDAMLPDGFRERPVSGPDDAAARAAVHAEAFAPSRVTEDSYRTVMAAWPYRPNLDRVVVAPDGRFAAYATAWLDDVRRVGVFEPVGTDPAYRRLGLAHAACSAALRALADAGASSASVLARGDAAYPAPARLYRSLGFQPRWRTRTYRQINAL
jgi:ribosomal protein S18 acetylase RimI-like enzyme